MNLPTFNLTLLLPLTLSLCAGDGIRTREARRTNSSRGCRLCPLGHPGNYNWLSDLTLTFWAKAGRISSSAREVLCSFPLIEFELTWTPIDLTLGRIRNGGAFPLWDQDEAPWDDRVCATAIAGYFPPSPTDGERAGQSRSPTRKGEVVRLTGALAC